MPRFPLLQPSWRALVVSIPLSLGAFLQIPSASAANPLPSLTVGGAHACAIREGGNVWCWGNNVYGQLGNGTRQPEPSPVRVEGLPAGITAISAGGFHTCAVEPPATVWCWGQNNDGQLGDGTLVDRPRAVRIGELGRKILAIAAGVNHTCALSTGDDIRCWGDNSNGQLGDATTVSERRPVGIIKIPYDVKSLSTGQMHSCALSRKGQLWCWGTGALGALGAGFDSIQVVPVQVTGIPTALKVNTAGAAHNCALDSDGEIWCWGDNSEGQLGDNLYHAKRPRKVMGLPASIKSISSGYFSSCALDSRDRVWCWGHKQPPAQVHGLRSGIQELAIGYFNDGCTLHSDDEVWCWAGAAVRHQVQFPAPANDPARSAEDAVSVAPTSPPKDDSELYDDEF